MSVLTVHTIVQRDGLSVSFAPGDELPEWAEGKVGAHCLDSNQPAPKPRMARAEPAEEDEPEMPKSTNTPDFTSAAPRRGRPRK